MSISDKKVTRTDFIKGIALAGTAVAIGSALKPDLRAFAQSTKSRGSASSGEWKPTTCQGCTSWCAVQTYVQDGRVIKIRGNSNSKVNGSASCVRSHMALQQVYDPDRIKVPMKRTNPKKG